MEKQELMKLFNLYIYSVGKAISSFLDTRLIIRTVGQALQGELGEELRRDLGFSYSTNGDKPEKILQRHSEFILQKSLAGDIRADLKGEELVFEVKNCSFAPATRLLAQERVSPPPCLQVGFLSGVMSRCCGIDLKVKDYQVSLDGETLCRFTLEVIEQNQ